jgi:MoaA/NifB/PqqE/SkfB family radical SAM enzyme
MNNEVLNIRNSELRFENVITKPDVKNVVFTTGIRMSIARVLIRLRLLRLIVLNYANPIDWIRALRYVIKKRRGILGPYRIKKIIKVNGSYYMGLYSPAWFSSKFDDLICSQLNDFKPLNKPVNRFVMVFLSVTNKCPLQCEHCYDWDQLNTARNILSTKDLIAIVDKLQKLGVGHIQFSGGEPLLRHKDIIEVVRNSNVKTDFWVATSGFYLDETKAMELKSAGIKGVIISLDHFDSREHNKFRNHRNGFNQAILAINNANKAKLIVAISICTTKSFISNSNLESFMLLAKKLNVAYVQFLEPMAVGHYKHVDVTISEEQINLLEQFYLTYNFTKAYSKFPIIIYPGYHQRKIGCMMSGKKSIYIDASGSMNPCPFCQKPYGNFLSEDFNDNLETIAFEGCRNFQ